MKEMMRVISNNFLFKIIAYSFLIGLISISIYYFIPEKIIPPNIKIDYILVEKSNRKMKCYSKNKLIKTYNISLGFQPIGKKHFEGDGKTPEGKYYIISKNYKSKAYKSLGISYPNANDKKLAQQSGRQPGENIMIHGMMNGKGYWGKFHRMIDWTAGCIAITNTEMDNLFNHVDVGCTIEIKK